MDETLKKIDAVINFKGKIHVKDWNEAHRLKRKLEVVGEVSLMDEMSLDSLLEMYEIPVPTTPPSEI